MLAFLLNLTSRQVAFGSIIGYMAGKISYVNTCKEKFLRLENSPIGEMLRKGGGMPSGQGGSFGLQLPGFQSSNDDPVEGTSSPQSNSDSYSSFNANDDYRANIDIDTSNVKTMDNHFDFELNNDADPELEAKRPEMTKTYEDLRRENRQHHPSQYTQVMPGHYQPRPQTRPQEPKVKKEKELPFSSGAIKKNKYGDEMEWIEGKTGEETTDNPLYASQFPSDCDSFLVLKEIYAWWSDLNLRYQGQPRMGKYQL